MDLYRIYNLSLGTKNLIKLTAAQVMNICSGKPLTHDYLEKLLITNSNQIS